MNVLGIRDHLGGLFLCVAYVAILLGTSNEIAMSRDESFYVVAAQDYGHWFELLASDPSRAFEDEVRDRAWDYNHEHPGLVKSLFALSWLAHKKWELFSTDSMAFRFPGMLSAGLLLWLLYIFGARAFRRDVGVFAALAYALMPRPFYHSHLNCFDIPITLAITFVVYCYWRSLTSRRWALWTGIAWGLALSTKHNSWVLPGIFLIHFIWMRLRIRGARKRGSMTPLEISSRPWWLLGMVVLGPPIFIATWPWLWSDQIGERFLWYANFHLAHVYYDIAYFGKSYFQPPFPISYPFIMTLFTVPFVTLALAFWGIAIQWRDVVPYSLLRRWKNADHQADPLCMDILLLGALWAPIVMIALPFSPIFGATKHWFPAYPFLALYAGLGFHDVIARVRADIPLRWARLRPVLSIGSAAIFLSPSALETWHSHPFGLSHYTFAAGGVPGSADHGMNRQFWGFTTGSLVDFFNQNLPNGGRVFLCDTTAGAWEMLKRDGQLLPTIRGTFDLVHADYAMVHIEHHFVEVDYQAWAAFGTPKLVHVLTYDGVPIINVYENPRRSTR